LIEEIERREEDRERVDRGIAAAEHRIRLGHLAVARTLRELEPVMAAWREALRGSPVRACQICESLSSNPS
jgi:hypothetical protein